VEPPNSLTNSNVDMFVLVCELPDCLLGEGFNSIFCENGGQLPRPISLVEERGGIMDAEYENIKVI
jgi:hypothetical protein